MEKVKTTSIIPVKHQHSKCEHVSQWHGCKLSLQAPTTDIEEVVTTIMRLMNLLQKNSSPARQFNVHQVERLVIISQGGKNPYTFDLVYFFFAVSHVHQCV